MSKIVPPAMGPVLFKKDHNAAVRVLFGSNTTPAEAAHDSGAIIRRHEYVYA